MKLSRRKNESPVTPEDETREKMIPKAVDARGGNAGKEDAASQWCQRRERQKLTMPTKMTPIMLRRDCLTVLQTQPEEIETPRRSREGQIWAKSKRTSKLHGQDRRSIRLLYHNHIGEVNTDTTFDKIVAASDCKTMTTSEKTILSDCQIMITSEKTILSNCQIMTMAGKTLASGC